jgi:hypothetical protein
VPDLRQSLVRNARQLARKLSLEGRP